MRLLSVPTPPGKTADENSGRHFYLVVVLPSIRGGSIHLPHTPSTRESSPSLWPIATLSYAPTWSSKGMVVYSVPTPIFPLCSPVRYSVRPASSAPLLGHLRGQHRWAKCGPSALRAPSRPATPPPSGLQGTQPGQADPPLWLPNTGLLAIPAPLVHHIQEGAFVDMGDLLLEALQWAFDRSLEEKGEKEKRKKFLVDEVSDWALSFATYMAIRVLPCPSLATPLATYMDSILHLAREVPGLAWQRYDRMFCQAVAGWPGTRSFLGTGGSQTYGWQPSLSSPVLVRQCHRPGEGPSPPHPPWRSAAISPVGTAPLGQAAASAMPVGFASQIIIQPATARWCARRRNALPSTQGAISSARPVGL